MSDTEIASIEQDMAADIDGYFKDALKVERYGQLIEARDSGTPAPAGPSTNQQRKAEIEQMMAEPGNSSPYWHSEELQAEYAKLIEGGNTPNRPVNGVDSDVSAETQEAQQRIDTAFDGIDTTDLDSAFEGMSGEAQQYAARIMADPSQREAYIMSMPEAALEELMAFVNGMPDHEVAALERALLLT